MFRPVFVILFAVSLLVTRLDRADAQTTLFVEEIIPIGFQNTGPFDFSMPNTVVLEGGFVPFAADLIFNELTGEVTTTDRSLFFTGVSIDRASNINQFFLPFGGGGTSSEDIGGTFRGPATLGANQFPEGITIDHGNFFGSMTSSSTLSITDSATGALLFDSFAGVGSPSSFSSVRFNRARGSLFVQQFGGTVREVLPTDNTSVFEELNDLGISLDQFEINQRDGNLYDISSDSVDIYDPENGSLLESIDISDFGIGDIVAHAIDSDRGNLLILEQSFDPGLGTVEDPGTIFVNLFRVGGIAVPEPSQLVIVPFLLALSARRRRS